MNRLNRDINKLTSQEWSILNFLRLNDRESFEFNLQNFRKLQLFQSQNGKVQLCRLIEEIIKIDGQYCGVLIEDISHLLNDINNIVKTESLGTYSRCIYKFLLNIFISKLNNNNNNNNILYSLSDLSCTRYLIKSIITNLNYCDVINLDYHYIPNLYIHQNINSIWSYAFKTILHEIALFNIIIKSQKYHNIYNSPPEVTSTFPCLADSSSNYLSLKSRATPGDRGEGSDGMKSSTRPQVEPAADLREAEGQLNREGSTPSGKTSGGDVRTTSGIVLNDMDMRLISLSYMSDEYLMNIVDMISYDMDLMYMIIDWYNEDIELLIYCMLYSLKCKKKESIIRSLLAMEVSITLILSDSSYYDGLINPILKLLGENRDNKYMERSILRIFTNNNNRDYHSRLVNDLNSIGYNGTLNDYYKKSHIISSYNLYKYNNDHNRYININISNNVDDMVNYATNANINPPDPNILKRFKAVNLYECNQNMINNLYQFNHYYNFNTNLRIHDPNTTPEVQSNSLGLPPEVQSTSVPLGVEPSSNYLSLKSKATPGDRGDNPVADLREAKGEVNKEGCLQDEGEVGDEVRDWTSSGKNGVKEGYRDKKPHKKNMPHELDNKPHDSPHILPENGHMSIDGLKSSDGSSIMGMMEDGAKDVLDVTSSGLPAADLREAEGEVNRRAVCKTTSDGDGRNVTSGGMDIYGRVLVNPHSYEIIHDNINIFVNLVVSQMMDTSLSYIINMYTTCIGIKLDRFINFSNKLLYKLILNDNLPFNILNNLYYKLLNHIAIIIIINSINNIKFNNLIISNGINELFLIIINTNSLYLFKLFIKQLYYIILFKTNLNLSKININMGFKLNDNLDHISFLYMNNTMKLIKIILINIYNGDIMGNNKLCGEYMEIICDFIIGLPIVPYIIIELIDEWVNDKISIKLSYKLIKTILLKSKSSLLKEKVLQLYIKYITCNNEYIRRIFLELINSPNGIYTIPPEVQSNSPSTRRGAPPPEVSPLAVEASSNYLSLKGKATPGDRGEGSDGSSIMGMMEDGAKDVLDVTSSGLPAADLREAKGEVNREGTTPSGKTSSGAPSGKTSGGNGRTTSGIDDVIIRRRYSIYENELIHDELVLFINENSSPHDIIPNKCNDDVILLYNSMITNRPIWQWPNELLDAILNKFKDNDKFNTIFNKFYNVKQKSNQPDWNLLNFWLEDILLILLQEISNQHTINNTNTYNNQYHLLHIPTPPEVQSASDPTRRGGSSNSLAVNGNATPRDRGSGVVGDNGDKKHYNPTMPDKNPMILHLRLPLPLV